jgi:Flp pilus assembly protein TadG
MAALHFAGLFTDGRRAMKETASELQPTPKLAQSGIARAGRRFRNAQEGSLTVFALCLFVLMVMMGGLAVDLMRYEATRTMLQNTLDRATLASASLTQTLEPKSVVNDYFSKAGMASFLEGVTVTEGMNFRNVVADATAGTNPYFMHLLGIDKFDAKGHSMAEQRVTNVEVVLALDVSGSMTEAGSAGSTKIADLKVAAKEFVQTVLSSDDENRISIAIVPYNAEVNLGLDLRSKFNAVNQHGVVNVDCLELPNSAYSTLTIDRSTPLAMAAFADTESSTNKTTSYVSRTDTNYATFKSTVPYCRNYIGNIVRMPSNNIATLQSQIDGLNAGGNTSIMAGMRWGLTLLDPAERSIYDEFVNDNKMSSYFQGRPYDWDAHDAMKLVVLMTDGEHVAHSQVPDAYKTGTSPIYKSTGDGNYSIRFTSGRPAAAGTNEYWVPHLSTWQATPWNSGAGSSQMDWKDVWAAQRQTWVAWQLYARALGTTSSTRTSVYNDTIAAFQQDNGTVAQLDAELQSTCTLAKNNGVIIYGIAFQAPTTGQTQIKNCATSNAHYFNAQGLQIQSAFRAIASNISQLRLTQ